MAKLAIFDLDGTLVDSLKDIVLCCNEALKARGCPTHTYQEYLTFIGDGGTKLVERALPKELRDPQTVREVRADYEERYSWYYDVETKPFDGVMEMIEGLIDRDVLLAVLTNKGDDLAYNVVEAFFPATFEVVMGQRDGLPQKPQPDGVLQILRELDVDPADCFFIGDSDVDILTGKNAGVHALGVAWGYRSVEELTAAGAEYVAKSPKRLGDYIAKH